MQSPFEIAQQNMARSVRSMLEMSKQVEARQTTAALDLMHQALGAFRPEVLTAMRDLLDVQLDLANGLGAQYRSTFDHVIERSGTFIGDLRQADDRNEMMGVVAMFASDMSARVHDDAGKVGKLVMSAAEAGKVLAGRGGDAVIGDDGAKE